MFGNESLDVDIISSTENCVGLNRDRISTILAALMSTMSLSIIESMMRFGEDFIPKSANSMASS